MLPTLLLIVVCFVLLILTLWIAILVTGRTQRDGGDGLLGAILSVIVSEALIAEAGLLISQVFSLPNLKFMTWPVGLMLPLEVVAYLVGYLWSLIN